MTYEEYSAAFDNVDHLLIRMTDTFPYFKEKRIIRSGKEYIETNHHIAYGMYCTYINYEVDSGLSAEIEKTIRFEGDHGDTPILVTNSSDSPIEIRVGDMTGLLHPREVLGIFPQDLRQVTIDKFENDMIEDYLKIRKT